MKEVSAEQWTFHARWPCALGRIQAGICSSTMHLPVPCLISISISGRAQGSSSMESNVGWANLDCKCHAKTFEVHIDHWAETTPEGDHQQGKLQICCLRRCNMACPRGHALFEVYDRREMCTADRDDTAERNRRNELMLGKSGAA